MFPASDFPNVFLSWMLRLYLHDNIKLLLILFGLVYSKWYFFHFYMFDFFFSFGFKNIQHTSFLKTMELEHGNAEVTHFKMWRLSTPWLLHCIVGQGLPVTNPDSWIELAWLAGYSYGSSCLHFLGTGVVSVWNHDWCYTQDQPWALLGSRQFIGVDTNPAPSCELFKSFWSRQPNNKTCGDAQS